MLMRPEEMIALGALVETMSKTGSKPEIFCEEDTQIGNILEDKGLATALDAWSFPHRNSNILLIYKDQQMLDLCLLEFDVGNIVYLRDYDTLIKAIDLAPI